MMAGMKQYQANVVRTEKLAGLGQVAAGLAHDIKNPLSAIRMTVQMLARNSAVEDTEALDVMLREIDRVDQAVSELLSLAQTKPVHFENCDLALLLEEVLGVMQQKLLHLR